MSYRCAVLAAVASLSISTAVSAAATVETSPFIAAPIAYNDFQDMPDFLLAGTPYTRGGITVLYVPAPTMPFEGTTGFGGWYSPDNEGYTSITLTDGSSFNQIQFLAASGWNNFGLEYELHLAGALVATGYAGDLIAGYRTYGFSDATFDEVRLQNSYGKTAFDPNDQNDALGLDNIAIGRALSAVPEPTTWALMVAGFGLVGSSLRRRKAALA